MSYHRLPLRWWLTDDAHGNQKRLIVMSHHAVMLQGSTFGTPGVEEHAHFLRDVANATAIRSALIKNWMLANIPGAPAVSLQNRPAGQECQDVSAVPITFMRLCCMMKPRRI